MAKKKAAKRKPLSAADRASAEKSGRDLARATDEGLGRLVHALDRDVVRTASNNSTPWSLARGGDDAYSDDYMRNIAKGGRAVQQMKMRDTGDYETERQADRDARKASKKPAVRKSGRGD
jgi:hypothetical protein